MSIFTDRKDKTRPLFNPGLALSLLAISLPFSAMTIVWIYSSGDFFTSPLHLAGMSAIAFVTSSILLWSKDRDGRITIMISQQSSEADENSNAKVPAEMSRK